MENNGDERYPLDDAAISLVAELRESMRAAQVSLNAVLTYFARQHNLKGNYQLADNGRELVLKTKQGVTQ